MRTWLLTVPALLALPLGAAAQNDAWYDQPEGSGTQSTAPANTTSYESASYNTQAPAEPPGKGLGMALRLGFGLPFGKIVDDDEASFDDFTAGQVLTQFDLTYAFTPNIVAGAYFGLHFGILPEDARDVCDQDGVSCSQLFLTTGLSGEYRFLPGNFMNPWAGANVGIEWALNSVDTDQGDASSTLFGAAFGATGGLDFELQRWGLGPFLGLQLGRYAKGSVNDGPTREIEERAFHYSVQLGARARYQFAQR
jgi:hypothetical protein